MTYASRPAQIDRIFKTMDDNNSHQMRIELETYIAELEAEKLHVSFSEPPISIVSLKMNEPPVWSQQHVTEADARRRLRALRKQNNYQ